ncbi:uncharacterized protein RSE6_09452 [Rhynchosporium secalis]|uniref:DUF6594 domain-containing protein n=1 Tax=Rhynchosporium secalis TaxID=38038 RepID=A0A1E1MHX2_RHYSE|nr:uncharacterized protein RSE6_09452 [Rhynchosporium secalis]
MSLAQDESDVMEKGQVPEAMGDALGEDPATDSHITWSFLIGLTIMVKRLRNFRPFKTKPTWRGEIIVRALYQCPEGYPRLAATLDCDENFMLYRRFGFLQARILLNKQDQLRELETMLDNLDQSHKHSDSLRLRSREHDEAEGPERSKLFREIEENFKQYTSLLSAARDLATFNRPPTRDFESVRSYFDEETPLSSKKERYIYRREDLITLKPGRENAWLDVLVERFMQNIPLRFTTVRPTTFPSQPQPTKSLAFEALHHSGKHFAFRTQKAIDEFDRQDLRAKVEFKSTGIKLFSRTRIDLLVSMVNVCIVVVQLVIPVYILWQLTTDEKVNDGHSNSKIIGVLTTFTLIFSGTLSLFTRARRHEILAAAAAYCAVLVMFIGNMKQLGKSAGSSSHNSTPAIQPSQGV